MGRRTRRRAAAERRSATTDRITRLRVSDEARTEFRRELGQEPISHVLGRLVEDELARRRATRVQHGTASDQDLLDTLDDAHDLHRAVEALVCRIEQRLANDHQPSNT